MQSATIGFGVSISGRGLFSGEPSALKVRQALSPQECERAGIAYEESRSTEQFAAHGLLIEQDGYRYTASPARYIEMPNCTVLAPPEGGPPLMVTEHLFCALWAAGIDHCRIVMQSGIEAPNHDGSAITLYREIAAAGSVALGERRVLKPTEALRVDDDNGSYLQIEPDDKLSIDYSFSHPELGEQRLQIDNVTRDWAVEQLLPARTFITQREAEALGGAGLLRNTHSEDALLIRPADGVLQPEQELRFSDEYARHKVLDLIGDLYILPAEWTGKVTAVRSGHKLNRAMARLMFALL